MAKLPNAEFGYLKKNNRVLILARLSPYYKVLCYCSGLRLSKVKDLAKCGLRSCFAESIVPVEQPQNRISSTYPCVNFE